MKMGNEPGNPANENTTRPLVSMRFCCSSWRFIPACLVSFQNFKKVDSDRYCEFSYSLHKGEQFSLSDHFLFWFWFAFPWWMVILSILSFTHVVSQTEETSALISLHFMKNKCHFVLVSFISSLYILDANILWGTVWLIFSLSMKHEL